MLGEVLTGPAIYVLLIDETIFKALVINPGSWLLGTIEGAHSFLLFREGRIKRVAGHAGDLFE